MRYLRGSLRRRRGDLISFTLIKHVTAEAEEVHAQLRRRRGESKLLKYCKKAQAVGFLPNARRDVEVEIVRMLPVVTPGEPRSPTTKTVGSTMPQKNDLAVCNTLAKHLSRCACLFERGLVCRLYGRTAPARKTAVHPTFDLLGSNRLRDAL